MLSKVYLKKKQHTNVRFSKNKLLLNAKFSNFQNWNN